MTALGGRAGLVLGGSSGIGAATLDALRRAGGRAVGVARTAPPRSDDRDGWVCADVADYGQLRNALCTALDGERVDFVVNCVAVGYYSPVGADYSEKWAEMLRTNVGGVLVLLSLIDELELPLRDLVHIGSMASRQMSMVPGNECYSVTKGAQQRLVDHFRDQHRDHMRVTTISPGFTRNTAFVDRLVRCADVQPPVVLDEHNSLTAADVADCVRVVLSAPPNVEWSEVHLRPVDVDVHAGRKEPA